MSFRELYPSALIALLLVGLAGCEENNTTVAPESNTGPTPTAPGPDLPRVVGAVSTSNTTVLVSFSSQMGDSATSTQNYVIVQENVNPQAGALVVTAADFSGPDMTAVELTTLSQNELIYRVTVSNVRDLADNPLASPSNQSGVTSSTFPGTPPSGAQLVDSDGDGLSDNIEQRGWIVTTVLTSGEIREREVTSDPFLSDTDLDGITDDVELQRASDPRSPDTDSDGIDDIEEIRTYFSSPTRQDTDGDRVSDNAEINRNFTSPISKDTDGDNFSDYDEIFDRSTDPLIADIPQIELELVGDIDLRLKIEYEEGEDFNSSESSKLVVESEQEEKEEVSLVGRTIVNAAPLAIDYACSQTGIGDCELPALPASGEPQKSSALSAIAAGVVAVGKFAGSKGAGALGYVDSQQPMYTSTSKNKTQEESANQQEISRTRVEKTSSGSVGIGLKIRNTGDVSFTLKNLVFTLLQRDPISRTSFKALATMNFADKIQDGVTLGAFNGETGILRVEEAEAPANLVKDLLANPTGLYIEVGTFDLLDAFGRNFAFLNEVTNARTALIMIDFGNGQVERARVATDVARNPDGTAAGIALGDALGRILAVDYETALRQDNVDSEVLVIIAYVTDIDGDGLFAREEFLYGTKDDDPDTDGDGISDFDEVKVGWDITLGETTRVYSDPLSADSDRDGLTDIEERDAAMTGVGTGPTDPNSPDTDGDGFCDGPGRLDNNSREPGSLYYNCRVGAGTDLRPLEPLLKEGPNLLVAVPLPNDLLVDPEADILAQFTQKLDENSTFSAFGSMTGFRFGYYFFVDPLTLVFNPDLPFKNGEAVDVIFNESLENIDGLPFDFDPETKETAESFSYRFNTRVVNTGSDGEFVTGWSALPEDPAAVAVADFDLDGHIDIATANSGPGSISILLSDGAGEFLPQVSYPVAGNSTQSIAVGDFNNDGRPDLATADAFFSPAVSVVINNGDGSFGAAATYSVEERPQSIIAADLDGNGSIDIATSNLNATNGFDPDTGIQSPTPDNVAVLLNNGDGTFGSTATYLAGDGKPQGGRRMAAADFDGDSYIDLAVTSQEDQFDGNGDLIPDAIDKVFILLNDGNGAFLEPVPYDAGTVEEISDIAAARLDSDDDLDLIVSKFRSEEVSLFLNQGDGSFGPAISYPATVDPERTPVELVAVDMDQDGDLDIATSNRSDSISVLENVGNGVLAAPRAYLAGNGPSDIAAADFDNDGDNDLVTSHLLSDDIFVHKNDGAGAFPTIAVGSSPADITSADFDGDGDIDLISVNEDSDDISLLLNQGNGGLADPIAYSVTGFRAGRAPIEAIAADLDSDGDTDIATANVETNNVSVLLNDGTGLFLEPIQYSVAEKPFDITVADLDGDGDLDLATSSHFSDGISFLRNFGDGTFAESVATPVGSNPFDIQAADLDGDGDFDLVLPNAGRDQVEVFLNSGDGAFALEARYDVGARPAALVAIDLDGDGDNDLATVNEDSGDVSILLLNRDDEDGSIIASERRVPGVLSESILSTNVVDIAAADIDGDGDLDLAVVDRNANDVVHLVNEGQGRFVRRGASGVGEAPSAVTAADLDGDGDLEFATSNSGSDAITILKNGRPSP
jgi:hypothetical protein